MKIKSKKTIIRLFYFGRRILHLIQSKNLFIKIIILNNNFKNQLLSISIMVFKINISEKSGKTYKLETENEELIGKELNDKIEGKTLLPELEGYELEITGASDKAGFTAMKNVEGTALKRLLLNYGKAMHRRPRREGKKPVSNPKPKGLRLRKTVRGKVISSDIVQINLKVLKAGQKQLEEIFGKKEAPAENISEEKK